MFKFKMSVEFSTLTELETMLQNVKDRIRRLETHSQTIMPKIEGYDLPYHGVVFTPNKPDRLAGNWKIK